MKSLRGMSLYPFNIIQLRCEGYFLCTPFTSSDYSIRSSELKLLKNMKRRCCTSCLKTWALSGLLVLSEVGNWEEVFKESMITLIQAKGSLLLSQSL